jgi:hypothetical protein
MASTKKSSRRLSTAEILRQIPAARRREKRAREVGLRATGAHYDRATRQIVVELSTGYGFTFPAERVRGLARATAAQRAALEVSPSGHGILWPALDTDASVPGLIENALGRSAVAKALGRRGGEATSPAKILAARANGARGGRPRKDRAV